MDAFAPDKQPKVCAAAAKKKLLAPVTNKILFLQAVRSVAFQRR